MEISNESHDKPRNEEYGRSSGWTWRQSEKRRDSDNDLGDIRVHTQANPLTD